MDTARADRDLMSVLAALRQAGAGDVLVVDAGGQDRAVAGELFATEAQRRGLAGLVLQAAARQRLDPAEAIEARERRLQAGMSRGGDWTTPQGGLFTWVSFPRRRDVAAVQRAVLLPRPGSSSFP